MKKFEEEITDLFGNSGDVLFERMTGSRMYGTNYEKGEHPFDPDYVSDFDFRGVFMINPMTKLQLPPFNEYSKTMKFEQFDTEFYEVEKLFFEGVKNNPNYMDLLFGDTDTLIGSSDKGNFLLENRNLFLSNKIADSFSGFAQAQLSRIKNHNRWFNKYPDIYEVQTLIEEAYKAGEIDANMISYMFSGSLSYAVTGEDANSKKLKSSLSPKEMLQKYFSDKPYDIKEYMKPHAISFLNLKTPLGFKVQKTQDLMTFLMDNASFSKSNESLYFIYDNGKGIFSKSGGILPSSPISPDKNEPIRFIMTFDYTKFKTTQDGINDLWKWKIERNEKRSELEKRFGYDVKHGMHTYRLLDSAIDVMHNGTYDPRLTGQKLQNAKDILSGQWSYEFLLSEANKKISELKRLKKLHLLPEEVDRGKLSAIYDEVLFGS